MPAAKPSDPPAATASAALFMPTTAPSALVVARTAETRRKMDENPGKQPGDWRVVAPCLLAALVILGVAGMKGAAGLAFKDNLFDVLPGVFGTMSLVSLFVERVIEVFVTAWCDPQTAVHEQTLNYWQARQARLTQEVQAHLAERNGTPPPEDDRKTALADMILKKQHAIEEAIAAADVEEMALLPYRARTQKASTWFGLAVGIFTSAVGFRVLHQIVAVAPLTGPGMKHGATGQYSWFVVADVLLTGAVLAGGSKLVHQIFTLYDTFMDSTRKGVADRGAAST